jgi:hypothetical protein
MKKIDIKRLHKVQKMYPNVPKGEGKTTFCFDMLLRSAQTCAYKELLYVTNTRVSALNAFTDFQWFLRLSRETFYLTDKNKLNLYGCRIIFSEGWEHYKYPVHKWGVVEDFYY